MVLVWGVGCGADPLRYNYIQVLPPWLRKWLDGSACWGYPKWNEHGHNHEYPLSMRADQTMYAGIPHDRCFDADTPHAKALSRAAAQEAEAWEVKRRRDEAEENKAKETQRMLEMGKQREEAEKNEAKETQRMLEMEKKILPAVHCPDTDDCNCEWASPNACASNDSSECFKVCCQCLETSVRAVPKKMTSVPKPPKITKSAILDALRHARSKKVNK